MGGNCQKRQRNFKNGKNCKEWEEIVGNNKEIVKNLKICIQCEEIVRNNKEIVKKQKKIVNSEKKL